MAIIPEPLLAHVTQRQMAELRFRLSRSYDNPFDPERIDAWAEIQAPDGTTRRANAFAIQDYERHMDHGTEVLTPRGDPQWAVRFTPATAGKHVVRLHAHDHFGDTANTEPLVCVADAGNGPGFVRVTGRWFSREDGSFLYPVPINLRSPHDTLLDGQEDQPEDRSGTEPYAEWLKRCGTAGITMVRPWLAPGFLGLEWNRDWRGYHGLGQYNLENAWRVDRLLQLAARHRVLVELAIWQHGPWVGPNEVDSQWLDSPYRREAGGPLSDPTQAPFDPTVRRLHLQQARYLAARWGADPALFGWTLWIEVDAVSPDRSTTDWHAALSAALTEQSWGRQPVSAEFRSATGDPAVWALPGIAYTQLGGYSWSKPSVTDVLPIRAETLAQYGKPSIVEEYGGTSDHNSSRRLAQEIHDGLWASWGLDLSTVAMPWWWNLIFAYGLERQHQRFSAFIAGADLRGTDWRTGMKKMPAGGKAFVRIGSDRAWVWLRPAGAPPNAFDPLAADPGDWFAADPARTVDLRGLDLPLGHWHVEIWDTWSERAPTMCELTVGDGPVLLPVPEATRDVALKLTLISTP